MVEIIDAEGMRDALIKAYETPLPLPLYNRRFREYLINELVPPMPRGQVALAAAITFVEKVFEGREEGIGDAYLSDGQQATVLTLCLIEIVGQFSGSNVLLLTSTNFDVSEVRRLGVRHLFEGVSIVPDAPIPTATDYTRLGIEIGEEIFEAWNTLDPTQKEESVIGWKSNVHSESS